MRWLVPSAAARPRRLRFPTPCSATWSIAAASRRSRADVVSSSRGMRVKILALRRTVWYMYRSVHDLLGRSVMGRQRIEHHATTSADPATVYALLRDGASWPSWSPIESFELERPGADEPEGVGAVRVLRAGRLV